MDWHPHKWMPPIKTVENYQQSLMYNADSFIYNQYKNTTTMKKQWDSAVIDQTPIDIGNSIFFTLRAYQMIQHIDAEHEKQSKIIQHYKFNKNINVESCICEHQLKRSHRVCCSVVYGKYLYTFGYGVDNAYIVDTETNTITSTNAFGDVFPQNFIFCESKTKIINIDKSLYIFQTNKTNRNWIYEIETQKVKEHLHSIVTDIV